MKFQKGILNDVTPDREQSEAAPKAAPPPPAANAESDQHVTLQPDRLFETQEEFAGSSRNYLKLFAIVVVLIVIAGAAFFYFSLPGIGDEVRAPVGAEDAVRDNFLSKQKRTATDVVFFQCDGYYWARVGVETRKDIPNPLYKIGSYAAKITQAGDSWEVTSQPITSKELDTPCK